jgi:hypothetical protein
MRALLAVLCLSLAACSSPDEEITFDGVVPGIQDQGPLSDLFAETTPVLFNSTLLFVVAEREQSHGTHLRVINEAGTVLGTGPEGFGLISAIVEEDRLYVIGTTDWSTQNELRLTSTADLVTWTDPVVIKKAKPGQVIFNTSISRDDTGFVLAYEVCETGTSCFTFRFAKSNDMLNWTDVGGRFLNRYSACPTIRYSNGKYYAFFLIRVRGQYITAVARSEDLLTWNPSRLSVLTPESLDPTSINTSDLDFAEVNGRLEMVWINGDQVSWGQTMRAQYEGSFADLVDALF